MKKIAIIRRNGFGDLLCAYPLVLYCRKHFPEASITLFVDERNAPLVPFLPPVDGCAVFKKRGNKYWNVLKMALKYRRMRYDMAICAKTTPMKLMNLFLFLLGAKKRVAYVDKKWHRFLINVPREVEKSKTHQALKGLRLLAPQLQTIPHELYPKLTLPSVQKREEHPRLLLCATTTSESSRLQVERYAALVNRLHVQFPLSVSILSQESDRKRAEALLKEIKAPTTLHFPRNFEAVMVLLNSCDLYFVGDGGVAHIGAALGKRAVVLFGGVDPLEWSPLSPLSCSLYDPRHVNHLCDEKIYASLATQLQEVVSWKRGLPK